MPTGPRELGFRDEDGTRVSYDIPYQPYYYMEPNDGRKGENISLYDTPLIKFEFPNEYRRRQAIDRLLEQEKRKDQQDRGSVRLFESISTVQQFLVDRYWKQNSATDLPVKVSCDISGRIRLLGDSTIEICLIIAFPKCFRSN